MKNDDPSSYAYHIRSVDYRLSANEIWKHHETLKLRTLDPFWFLVAHSLELSLKSHLLQSGMPTAEVVALGHNLHSLFEKVCARDSDIKRTVLKNVKRRWINVLKRDRNEKLALLRKSGMDDEWFRDKMKVFSNDEIARNVPDPQQAFEWLAERHLRKGSVFRYHETRLETLPCVTLKDQLVETPPLTLIWFAEELQRSFQESVSCCGVSPSGQKTK